MPADQVSLSTSVAAVLPEVTVTVDPPGAWVGAHQVTASSTAQLRANLADLIYARLHAGQRTDPAESDVQPHDADFVELLAAATPHRYTKALGRVLSVDTPDTAVVALDSVRVRVARSALPGSVTPRPDEMSRITISCARPNLSAGYFLVDGSLGHGLHTGPNILRVYVHLAEPDRTVDLWASTLTMLEERQVPYRTKIVAARSAFPRRDGMVIYLGERARAAVPAIVDQLAGCPGRGEDSSPFAHPVAPGVALAWQPDDRRPGRAGLSFGEHRSQAMADGLLAHAEAGGSISQHQALVAALRESNIDPTHPFRNDTSPELPGRLHTGS